MPNEIFSFDLTGIEAMVREMKNVEDDVSRRIDETLTRLAHQVIADAKRLAPIDSGDLEASLIVGDVKRRLEEVFIEFGNSPETDHYAAVQHEGFAKRGDGKVVHFTPGEKTRSKGSHKGYEPGKKYLENAIKMNEKLITEEIQKVLNLE